MANVSLYINDDLLAELDARVEREAAQDRQSGRTGRKVTNRSSLMEQFLENGLEGDMKASHSVAAAHGARAAAAGAAEVEPFDISAVYGTMVFDDRAMRAYLTSDVYAALRQTIDEGKSLDITLANNVAEGMKNWAVAHGATHYTHWFQPLSGTTSEKHDAFMDPCTDGSAIAKFKGSALIQGESDASSFPNGGLRATFEARGYTAWDPTSYAFIKDEVLCIPTAFASYTGEALDKKTPLLRSMAAISDATKRVLAIFGEDTKQVSVSVGAEQEFFLIPKEDYARREDLVLTGRTLFGSAPCKGQELEEHYYGSIRPTVNNFMKELDDELWALGIAAKTKHNEVAPAQHELAPIFTTCNRAVDENLLTMEKMTLLASHYGLACLFHEKPFEGINGSGKHNNWSVCADGANLLDPGKNPRANLRFLVFMACIVAAVDDYQDLLRLSVASAGNDHRLGANEAPPAIVSIFLGEDLTRLVEALIGDSQYTTADKVAMNLGAAVLPDILKDNTDRNRTSPFAFTGNKFEFRMPGSNFNLSDCNTVLNTAVAAALADFADALAGTPAEDIEAAAIAYVKQLLSDHQRIIFNGNGYSKEWEEEAVRRGLVNNKTTADALPSYVLPKNIALFERMGVMSEIEVRSRYDVELEKYNKLITIEARVMQRMTRRTYLPAINRYAMEVAKSLECYDDAHARVKPKSQMRLLDNLLEGIEAVNDALLALDEVEQKVRETVDHQAAADYNAHVVVPAMDALRDAVDAMEVITDRTYWPAPSYNNMLFYV